MRKLDTIAVVIAAPRQFVFAGLSAYGRPSPLWEPGFEPEVVEDAGSTLTVRCHSRVMGRNRVSLRRIRLYPPGRITYEMLEGSHSNLREEITLSEVDDFTGLEYNADICVGIPVVGGVIERCLTAPMINRTMETTIQRYRVQLEAAASAAGLVDLRKDASDGRRRCVHRIHARGHHHGTMVR